VTALAETDTYGFFSKAGGTTGGLKVTGITESDGYKVGLALSGYSGDIDTTHGTGAMGAVTVGGYKSSGTDVTNIDAEANVFVVRTYIGGGYRALFIVDAEGDTFQDGTAGTAYDEHDDALALWDMSYALQEDTEKQKMVKHYNLERLKAMGIVSVGQDGRTFVSNKKQAQLVRGAMGQMYQRMQQMESELRDLKAKMRS
jgi:hypothetical protein